LGNEIDMLFRILVVFQVPAGATLRHEDVQEAIDPYRTVGKLLALKRPGYFSAGVTPTASEEQHTARLQRRTEFFQHRCVPVERQMKDAAIRL
jgi:hypothetical protein